MTIWIDELTGALVGTVVGRGALDVSTLATAGDGSAGNPWTGWEPAFNALPANSHIHFPAGNYTLATRITVPSGCLVTGDGMQASIITTAIATTAMLVGNPPSGGLPGALIAWATLRDFQIVCTNAANTGSGILVSHVNFATVDRVLVNGSRYGIATIYAEVTDIVDCNIISQLASGASIWCVNNGDYNLANADLDYSGAASGINNVTTVRGTQISPNAAAVGIAIDGNYSYTIGPNNNFNAGAAGVRLSSTFRATVFGNHFEITGPSVKIASTFFKSGSAGGVNGAVNTFSNYFGGAVSPIQLSPASVCVLTVRNEANGGASTTISGCATGFAAVNSIAPLLVVEGSFPNTGTLIVDAAPNAKYSIMSGASGTSVSALLIKEGSNARMGVATLNAGTPAQVVVANTSVTANTRIFLTKQTLGVTGNIFVLSQTAGVGFTIQSSAAADNAIVAWLLIEPGP